MAAAARHHHILGDLSKVPLGQDSAFAAAHHILGVASLLGSASSVVHRILLAVPVDPWGLGSAFVARHTLAVLPVNPSAHTDRQLLSAFAVSGPRVCCTESFHSEISSEAVAVLDCQYWDWLLCFGQEEVAERQSRIDQVEGLAPGHTGAGRFFREAT